MADHMRSCPEPTITVVHLDGGLTVAQWVDPWDGHKRTASGQRISDDRAIAKARAAIALKHQRMEEDRLTYGGPRPSTREA